MTSTRDPDVGWDKRARLSEVRWQKITGLVAAVGVLVAIATAWAAVVAARQATLAVSTAQEAVLRASREQRVSAGIAAMGGDTAAERIAGIGLLSRAATAELERVAIEQREDPDDERSDFERRDAVAAYLATMDALENYVKGWPDTVADGRRRALTGRVPSDVYYATGEIRRLTNAESHSYVEDDEGSDVAIDLQSAHLYGVPWKGLDVSWTTFYARFADLRFATLTDSHLGSASLVCADLRHANLSGADLSGADLRGAVLRHADLTGADLTGAMLWGADLTGATITQAQRDSAKSAGLGARPAALGPEPAGQCLDRVTPG